MIIYNKEKKRHVKLSEEVYKYIIFAEEEKLSIKEFIDCFENENDRKYVISIIKIMTNNEIINGKAYEVKPFKDIHLSLTNRCNLNCKDCFLKFKDQVTHFGRNSKACAVATVAVANIVKDDPQISFDNIEKIYFKKA